MRRRVTDKDMAMMAERGILREPPDGFVGADFVAFAYGAVVLEAFVPAQGDDADFLLNSHGLEHISLGLKEPC